MAPKSKASKSVSKKTASRKKATATARKKKTTAKSVKKTTAKKTVKKAVPKKSVKKTTAKKKEAAKPKKKTASIKRVKKPPVIKQPFSAEPVVTIATESISITSVTVGGETPVAPSSDILIGKVTHYFNHANAAVIELEAGSLQVGETIHIKGHTTDFKQVVESMQIDDRNVESAEPGQTIGIKVRDVVREHDKVYKRK